MGTFCFFFGLINSNMYEMGQKISRQKIAENASRVAGETLEAADIWYDETDLLNDHIDEILTKWNSIDDEIWAKTIVMEKNRRIAKAYIRAPILSVNNEKVGLEKSTLGVGGFENMMKEDTSINTLNDIGSGFKIRMDEGGNIHIKRLSKMNVCFRSDLEDDVHYLDVEKSEMMFDMKKFQQTVAKEMRKISPDWFSVRRQAISLVSFGDAESSIMDQDLWILVVNVVALDLLRTRLENVRKVSLAVSTETDDVSVSSVEMYSKPQKSKDPYIMGHPTSWHKKQGPFPPTRTA